MTVYILLPCYNEESNLGQLVAEISQVCRYIQLSLHDPEALAERIEQILNNPNLARELREQNLRFAQGRTRDKIASLFCKVYEQIKR